MKQNEFAVKQSEFTVKQSEFAVKQSEFAVKEVEFTMTLLGHRIKEMVALGNGRRSTALRRAVVPVVVLSHICQCTHNGF